MADVWVRAGLIVAALAIAGVAVVIARHRSLKAPRRIESTGLRQGVYLMTSSTCSDCVPARARMEETLGPDAYVEIRWEEEPDIFDELAVGGVPSTLLVNDDGSGTLWPGPPDRALRLLGP